MRLIASKLRAALPTAASHARPAGVIGCVERRLRPTTRSSYPTRRPRRTQKITPTLELSSQHRAFAAFESTGTQTYLASAPSPAMRRKRLARPFLSKVQHLASQIETALAASQSAAPGSTAPCGSKPTAPCLADRTLDPTARRPYRSRAVTPVRGLSRLPPLAGSQSSPPEPQAADG